MNVVTYLSHCPSQVLVFVQFSRICNVLLCCLTYLPCCCMDNGDCIQIILCQASSLQAASCGILSRYCNMHIVCSSVAGICQYYLVVACANPWKLLGDRVYFVVDGIMNVVKISDISLCAYSEVSIIQKTVTNCCRYRWTLCFVLLSTQSCSRFNPSWGCLSGARKEKKVIS